MTKITYTAPSTTSGGGSFDPSLVSFRYVQGSPSASWIIAHNLGFSPGGIIVIDSNGSVVEGEIDYIDNNNLILNFFANGIPSPFSGQAYLS